MACFSPVPVGSRSSGSASAASQPGSWHFVLKHGSWGRSSQGLSQLTPVLQGGANHQARLTFGGVFVSSPTFKRQLGPQRLVSPQRLAGRKGQMFGREIERPRDGSFGNQLESRPIRSDFYGSAVRSRANRFGTGAGWCIGERKTLPSRKLPALRKRLHPPWSSRGGILRRIEWSTPRW